jgi:3-carboxy-cis,cis-muconate cycloisomerase
MSVLGPLFRWEAVESHFSDRARLQAMLDVEAALVRAQARAGLVPAPAAAAVAGQCSVDGFDLDALGRAAALAGNVAVPLVAQLRARVAREDAGAARYVHRGATSQDVIDTALVLQLRGALVPIRTELDDLAAVLARLARQHRATPMAGRTWMQQAAPTTFGLEVAGWLDAVDRHRERLSAAHRRVSVLQFGGAVGNLAALGEPAMTVAAALADELGLALPAVPWHTHRDRLAELATTIGLCLGTLAKIARDIALHAQTEVAELSEPVAPGRGTSSTMPQKRNPVGSAVVLAAAARVPGLVASVLGAMVQEQQRALGGWPAEWELLPETVSLFGGALHRLTRTVAGLHVDAAAMRRNLEASRGLVFAEAVQHALQDRLGDQARQVVEAACHRARQEDRHLRDVLVADPAVSAAAAPDELARLFDPMLHLGAADALVESVLAAHARHPAAAAAGGD